jgi:hypothetical protein
MVATKRLRRDDNHFVAADRMKHAHAIAIGWERFAFLQSTTSMCTYLNRARREVIE